jgi:hypothetical protein
LRFQSLELCLTKLEHEVGRKPILISLDRFIETECWNAVERRQIAVEDDFLGREFRGSDCQFPHPGALVFWRACRGTHGSIRRSLNIPEEGQKKEEGEDEDSLFC